MELYPIRQPLVESEAEKARPNCKMSRSEPTYRRFLIYLQLKLEKGIYDFETQR